MSAGDKWGHCSDVTPGEVGRIPQGLSNPFHKCSKEGNEIWVGNPKPGDY